MFTGLLRKLAGVQKEDEAAGPWDLSRPLLKLSTKDALTIGRASEGVLIMGGTGAGKSSASGRQLILSFLNAGFGGLVLCAKSDETRMWQRYCAETGRSEDLIIFSPEHPWRFNFLDFELQRKGRGAGLTENLRKLLAAFSRR
jgi:hypothetical protein